MCPHTHTQFSKLVKPKGRREDVVVVSLPWQLAPAGQAHFLPVGSDNPVGLSEPVVSSQLSPLKCCCFSFSLRIWIVDTGT